MADWAWDEGACTARRAHAPSEQQDQQPAIGAGPSPPSCCRFQMPEDMEGGLLACQMGPILPHLAPPIWPPQPSDLQHLGAPPPPLPGPHHHHAPQHAATPPLPPAPQAAAPRTRAAGRPLRRRGPGAGALPTTVNASQLSDQGGLEPAGPSAPHAPPRPTAPSGSPAYAGSLEGVVSISEPGPAEQGGKMVCQVRRGGDELHTDLGQLLTWCAMTRRATGPMPLLCAG